MAFPQHAKGQPPSPLARSNNAANHILRHNTPLPLPISPTQSVPTQHISPISHPDSLGHTSQYETQPNKQFLGQSQRGQPTHSQFQYDNSSYSLPPQDLPPRTLTPRTLTPRTLTPRTLTPRNVIPQNLTPQHSPFQSLPPRGSSFQSSLTTVPPVNLQQPRVRTKRKQKEQKESTLEDKLKDADERTKLLMDFVGLMPSTDCSYDEKEKAANTDFANSLQKTVDDMKAVELAPQVKHYSNTLNAAKLKDTAKETHKSVLQMLSKLREVTVTPKKRRVEDLGRNSSGPTEGEKRQKQLVMSSVTHISTQPMTPCKSVNAQRMPTPEPSAPSDNTQSASQTGNQSAPDEPVVPVQYDDQLFVDEEAEVIDDAETAANTVPEKPSAPTTNRATSALEMQNLDQKSDPADETPTRQRTTRAATRAKRAPPARKPRKKANEFKDIPFYICLPDGNPKYEPIATLPDSVRETLLSAYDTVCRHKDHEVRYSRMTRNPATYTEKRNLSCVFVQLIGHGKNSSKWANGDSDFACDGCTNSDRLCVRICSMAEIRTGGSSEEYGLCISPLPKPDRLTDDCKDAGFWLAEDVGG